MKIKNKLAMFFYVLGVAFMINAVLGRYIVLPGFLEGLKENNGEIPKDVHVFYIIRYLLWAFSYKLGIYFFIIGILVTNKFSRSAITIFSVIGITYISMAYMDLTFYSSLYFGICGVLVTIMALWMLCLLPKETTNNKTNVYDLLGMFFILMAFYNLCPLLGVRCFGLDPEKMIEYKLQKDAISFANHIMSEFVLGFGFFLYSKIRKVA